MIAVLLLWAVAPAPLVASAGGAPALLNITPPENAYIADTFAVREDAELAYVTTEADRGHTNLHLLDVRLPDRPAAVHPISGPVVGLRWLGPGRLLVIARPDTGTQVLGQVFTTSGPMPAGIGPADHIGLARYEGQPVIAVHQQPEGNATTHRMTALEPTTLRPLVTRSFRISNRQQIATGDHLATVLWWGDDHATVSVRHPGVFDQARDLRLPDRFGRVDLLTGRLVVDAAIQPLGFSRLVSLHRLFPGRSVFVHPDPRSGKLLLVDEAHWIELRPRQSLSRYDLGRTRSQALDARRVLLSLAIDPANPTARAKGRRDRDDLEFYLVDRASGAMAPVFSLAGRDGPVSWSASANRLLVLRRHRTYSAGGVSLELYDISAARPPHGAEPTQRRRKAAPVTARGQRWSVPSPQRLQL